MNSSHSFTAIDFETACHDRQSICQVGLVRVENGEVIKELNILVQPPGNYYHPMFPRIHGIGAEMTKAAPFFAKVWVTIAPYIIGQTVVAHNMSFDGSCLKSALTSANLAVGAYEARCTYKIFGKALNVLCGEYDIPLKHHDALSDARACAELYRRHLNNFV